MPEPGSRELGGCIVKMTKTPRSSSIIPRVAAVLRPVELSYAYLDSMGSKSSGGRQGLPCGHYGGLRDINASQFAILDCS